MSAALYWQTAALMAGTGITAYALATRDRDTIAALPRATPSREDRGMLTYGEGFPASQAHWLKSGRRFDANGDGQYVYDSRIGPALDTDDERHRALYGRHRGGRANGNQRNRARMMAAAFAPGSEGRARWEKVDQQMGIYAGAQR